MGEIRDSSNYSFQNERLDKRACNKKGINLEKNSICLYTTLEHSGTAFWTNFDGGLLSCGVFQWIGCGKAEDFISLGDKDAFH